jgi:predicted kinase
VLTEAKAGGLRITIPEPSLVVLVGAAGAGKSTFAARHFQRQEVLSSDAIRAAVSGDEADQRATRTAFSIIHRDLARRLGAKQTVVIDATNVERHARRPLVARASAAGLPAIAIVLDLPPELVHERNRLRPSRVVDREVVTRHLHRLAFALARDELATEGFAAIHVIRAGAELVGVIVTRESSADPLAAG